MFNVNTPKPTECTVECVACELVVTENVALYEWVKANYYPKTRVDPECWDWWCGECKPLAYWRNNG